MSEHPTVVIALSQEIARREKELAVLKAARDLMMLDTAEMTVTVSGGDSASNGDGKGNGHVSHVQATPTLTGRERTARLLEEFDRREVASLEAAAARAGIMTRNAGIGVLVRHGYLKRKGGGYVRTGKAFHAA